MAVKITKVLSKNSPSTKVINIKFDIGDNGDGIKKVEDTFTFAMSKDSTGLYKIGKDVEKFCGIKEADVIKQVNEGKDRPEDAIIYGMTNVMNGGKDIYMWINATRYGGMSEKVGPIPAMIEVLSHEATHLAKLVFTRHIAKTKNISLTNEDWIKHNYGAGSYNWPTNGDLNDKNKLIQISDESFATLTGQLAQEIAPYFLKFSDKHNGK